MLAAGEELPRIPAQTMDAPEGTYPEPVSRPYLPLLVPCRLASLLATALTVAIVAFLAARMHSVIAAILASVLLVAHWLTQDFAATANFDPLLTFLVALTAPILFAIWNAPHRALRLAPLLGLVCAAAFQTRLNGGIAFAASAVVLLARRQRKTLLALIVTGIVFVLASIAMNPYYWAAAPDTPVADANLVERFQQQVADLAKGVESLRPAGKVRLPLWASPTPDRAPVDWLPYGKARFLRAAMAGDFRGIAMLVGALLFVILSRQRTFTLAWAIPIVAITVIWLPLPWPRYLLLVLPPLALMAGMGFASVITAPDPAPPPPDPAAASHPSPAARSPRATSPPAPR